MSDKPSSTIEDSTAKVLDSISQLVDQAKGLNKTKDTKALSKTVSELEKQVRLLNGDKIKIEAIKLID